MSSWLSGTRRWWTTRYRESGGEDIAVDTESGVPREAGHEVRHFIARNPSAPSATVASIMLSPWNPVSVRRLRRSIEEFAPDVAHVHNTLYAMSPAVKQRGALLEIWQRAKDAHGTSRRST